jgi:hypothetical protein
MEIAIVENAATGRHFKRPLLLLGRALYEIFVMDHLQPDQAAANQRDPADKEKRNVQKTQATVYRAGLHWVNWRSTGGLPRSPRGSRGWARRLAEKLELRHLEPTPKTPS